MRAIPAFVAGGLFVAGAGLPPLAAEHDEVAMRARCERFLSELDPLRIAQEYGGAVKELLSLDPARKEAALATLAATRSPDAIPWILPFLDASESSVRVHAGLALSRIVEASALARRDPAVPERVVLRSRRARELDLRPLAWVALRMLRMPDDGNVRAQAAVLVRYLELREFQPELRELLESRHPAVRQAATWALEELRAEAGASAARRV